MINVICLIIIVVILIITVFIFFIITVLIFIITVLVLIISVVILVIILHRLIVIDAFRYAGRALGVQLAAHITTQVQCFYQVDWIVLILGWLKRFLCRFLCDFQFGWSAIFGLNFFLIVANLIYIGCVVVDKKKPVRDGTSGDYLANITVISSAYLIFVAGTTGGAYVNFFCQV